MANENVTQGQRAASERVSVSLDALRALFDMGNHSSCSDEAAANEGEALLRNVIGHAVAQLRVLGDVMGAAKRTLSDDELATQAWCIASHLEAAAEIATELDRQPKSTSDVATVTKLRPVRS
jgi:hypothetical protein